MNIAIPNDPSDDVNGLYRISENPDGRPIYTKNSGHVLMYKEVTGGEVNKWVISTKLQNGQDAFYFDDMSGKMECPEMVMASGYKWSGPDDVVIDCGWLIISM